MGGPRRAKARLNLRGGRNLCRSLSTPLGPATARCVQLRPPEGSCMVDKRALVIASGAAAATLSGALFIGSAAGLYGFARPTHTIRAGVAAAVSPVPTAAATSTTTATAPPAAPSTAATRARALAPATGSPPRWSRTRSAPGTSAPLAAPMAPASTGVTSPPGPPPAEATVPPTTVPPTTEPPTTVTPPTTPPTSPPTTRPPHTTTTEPNDG